MARTPTDVYPTASDFWGDADGNPFGGGGSRSPEGAGPLPAPADPEPETAANRRSCLTRRP